MNINSQWKKFVAVGCSHGNLADGPACQTVLDFSDKWKPQTRIHLGDLVDMAAFRGGAKGSKDEAEAITPDLESGVGFLKQFHPDYLLNGNHDIRLWESMGHHNAILAHAAQSVVRQIKDAVEEIGCHHVEHYDILRSWITLGDTKFLHGWMYNEQAMRDHAEHFGKCVIAHLHVPGEATGRRIDSPRCVCVGTLADISKMTYAHRRRATARWNNAFAFGEYSDSECVTWLAQKGKDGSWRLPL
jgi:predicted phosphodiesterase